MKASRLQTRAGRQGIRFASLDQDAGQPVHTAPSVMHYSKACKACKACKAFAPAQAVSEVSGSRPVPLAAPDAAALLSMLTQHPPSGQRCDIDHARPAALEQLDRPRLFRRQSRPSLCHVKRRAYQQGGRRSHTRKRRQQRVRPPRWLILAAAAAAGIPAAAAAGGREGWEPPLLPPCCGLRPCQQQLLLRACSVQAECGRLWSRNSSQKNHAARVQGRGGIAGGSGGRQRTSGGGREMVSTAVRLSN